MRADLRGPLWHILAVAARTDENLLSNIAAVYAGCGILRQPSVIRCSSKLRPISARLANPASRGLTVDTERLSRRNRTAAKAPLRLRRRLEQ
jgi:hypothetical protein